MVRVASLVPWEQVCKMLDKVQSAPKDVKRTMLVKFINQYRKTLIENKQVLQNDESFFPVLRVLLPALDRDRGAYGVKEKKLAELYLRILGLNKDGIDGQRLLNFRKPKTHNSDIGDFAEVAYYVLLNRCPSKGTLSLLEVDEYLTFIAEKYAAKEQDEVEKKLMFMLRNMTASEQKWLIRVLLKDMHLGVGQSTIFNIWHPDGKDYYDVSQVLRDPNIQLHEIEITLFSPFRPMLAERADIDKITSKMNQKTYFVETKFDGERSQIHKKGNSYKYFSRNGFDFTTNFGENCNEGIFTPYLHPLFKINVNEIILDGELVGWSKKHKTIISKGENLDVKHLKENGNWQVCFCVFDILYLNGSVLTNKPLAERIQIFEEVIQPLEGRVVISTTSKVTTKEEVISALNEAIDNCEEGLVLKDPDSVYKPATRKGGWIKLKPEYVSSLVSDLDLLIIGGYYGKGQRHGTISSFLVGVISIENGLRSIISVCRVGSGYTMEELENLIEKLKPHMVFKQPSDIIVSREKPDEWIVPSKSCVLQVKAAEIIKSDLYATNFTLRFPRVEKIRFDKPWHDVLTLEELETLQKESKGKLAMHHYVSSSDADISPQKKRGGTRAVQLLLPDHFKPADSSDIVKKGKLLNGLEICVVEGGCGKTKQELELLIAENGGTFSQNPRSSTYCIIADRISVRVSSYINSGLYNILHSSWLILSLKTGHLLPWGPHDSIFLRTEDEGKMKKTFDKFGDSFCEPTSEDMLKKLFESISAKKVKMPLCEIIELDKLLLDTDNRTLFRSVVGIFVDKQGSIFSQTTSIMSLQLRLYGGQVKNFYDSSVTHVFTNDWSCTFYSTKFMNCYIVVCNWIQDCIVEGKLLYEAAFCPSMKRESE